ncbi:MAG: response regulator receiver protein [Acidobacteriales bacterium]|nr:response regulator receiver protein [Terriglobales bacterium]
MPNNLKIIESKRRILIVDDDKSIRNMLALIMAAEGYEVAKASNGFDALEHVKNSLPALVISDLNMPLMSGFELLSVLRRRFPKIVVVAMSSAYHSGDEIPGGVIADGFYPKGGGKLPDFLTKLVADLFLISSSGETGLAGRGSRFGFPAMESTHKEQLISC